MKRFALLTFLFFPLLAVANDDDETTFLRHLANTPVQMELLLAAPTTASAASVTGHMALRLRYTDAGGVPRDLVLGFLAHVGNDQGTTAILKSMTPVYPVVLQIEHFQSYVKKTTITEGRAVKRYLLPSDERIAKNIFQRINDIKDQTKPTGKYEYLRHNCASIMYEFLGSIGYFINSDFNSRPMPPIPPLAYAGLFLRPVLLGLIEAPPLVNPKIRVEEIYKKLNLQVVEDKVQNIGTLVAGLPSLSVFQLNLLLDWTVGEYPGLRHKILLELARRPHVPKFTSFELVGYQEISAALYKLCTDTPCADQQAAELSRMMDRKQLRAFYYKLQNEESRSAQMGFGRRLSLTPQYTSFQLLMRSLSIF